MRLTQTVKVPFSQGMHMRPVTLIVKLLQSVDATVTFTYQGQDVNAKSIIGVLSLAIPHQAALEITVDGQDAKRTLEKVLEIFQEKGNCGR